MEIKFFSLLNIYSNLDHLDDYFILNNYFIKYIERRL